MINVLTVGESDPRGVKGIQADVKTITAMNAYALSAVSYAVSYNKNGSRDFKVMEPEFVASQLRSAIGEFEVKAVKIGSLFGENIVNAVADVIDEFVDADTPIVIDPNMVGREGKNFVDAGMLNTIKRRLYHKTNVITPNVMEAEAISGMSIKDIDDMRRAAEVMLTLGIEHVVLKSDQAVLDKVIYLVASEDDERIYERDKLEGRGTLGAGNVLSTAIAVSLAEGMEVFPAIERGIGLMHQSILHSKNASVYEGAVNFNLSFGHESQYCKLLSIND